MLYNAMQINTTITNKKYFHLSNLISVFAKSCCLSLVLITGHSLPMNIDLSNIHSGWKKIPTPTQTTDSIENLKQ